MSNQRFTPEFKEEAVKQVVERGYTAPDVAPLLVARSTPQTFDLRKILLKTTF